jgi:hypothetical protein
MEIKKSGLIFKLAYGNPNHYIHSFETNLCQIIRNIISNLFTNTILGILKAIGYVLLFAIEGIVFFLGFWFARRPAVFKGEERAFKTRLTVGYKTWPTFKGWRIYPIWILIIFMVFINRVGIVLSIKSNAISAAQHSILLPNFWFGLGVCVVLILIACMTKTASESETFVVFRAYLRAKKEKVCPMVKIVE